MSALYLSEHEKAALRSVDLRRLEELVDEALWQQRMTGLYDLNLSRCGSYVASQLYAFEQALADYAKAKAAKKREDLRGRAWMAGRDLGSSVRAMLERADTEEKERQLFRIDDMIHASYRFSEHLEIRVHFDWRSRAEDQWTFGTITFVHDVDTRPDYTQLQHQPKRKPSAAKMEQERQDTLHRHWEHFRMLAIHAVREFLQNGGDGAAIPERFVARTSGYDRYLNNFSCDFWEKSDAIRQFERAEPFANKVDGPSDEYSSDGRIKLQGRVKHAKFGDGVVTHIEADKVTADFGERGSKRVLANFLEPLHN